MDRNWREKYAEFSGQPIADASPTTRKLLLIVEENGAAACFSSKTRKVRIRTVKDKPAARIDPYTREPPGVWIHFRARRDPKRKAEFFATANLSPADWEQPPNAASYRYVGNPERLLEAFERALRVLLHDTF